MADQQGGAPAPADDEERPRRRRPIAWWWWAAVAGIAVVLVAVLLFGGGDDDEGSSVAASSDSGGQQSGEASPASASDASSDGGTGSTASSDGDDPGDRPAIEGVWEFIVAVTQTSGDCAGEETEQASVQNIRIRHRDGGGYAVTGFGSNPDDEWTGGWDGDRFVFNGERDEDGGRTVASFTMHFDEGGALVGYEDWSWSDAEGNCPTGKSDVEAYFYGPLN